MGRRNNSVLLLVIMVVVIAAAAAVVPGLAALTYHVGDSSGWMPPTGGFNFSNWAAQHTFVTGDILIFDFITGQHTAAKVTENDYANCNTANPIINQGIGPANYTLAAGSSFFICTFSNHCSQGQKLAVTVASSAGPAPQSSPTAPSPPSNTLSPPPPPSSAKPAAVVASSLIFLSIFTTLFRLHLHGCCY